MKIFSQLSYRSLIDGTNTIGKVTLQQPVDRHVIIEQLHVGDKMDEVRRSKQFADATNLTILDEEPVRCRHSCRRCKLLDFLK